MNKTTPYFFRHPEMVNRGLNKNELASPSNFQSVLISPGILGTMMPEEQRGHIKLLP